MPARDNDLDATRFPEAKKLFFVGSSLRDLRAMPYDARRALGYNLDLVQHSLPPEDWRPMQEIGAGVIELRVHTPDAFRVFYVAKFPEAVYVLHAFNKKTERTAGRDKNIGRARYAELLEMRRRMVRESKTTRKE